MQAFAPSSGAVQIVEGLSFSQPAEVAFLTPSANTSGLRDGLWKGELIVQWSDRVGRASAEAYCERHVQYCSEKFHLHKAHTLRAYTPVTLYVPILCSYSSEH